jgi:hypothetical protein
MKSLKQYLAESEKTYEFKLRSVVEMSDEQLDRLERYLSKYNVESVSAPKKSILQKSPVGFGDYGPAEVHTLDITTRLAVTPHALHEEISRATGVPMGVIRVHYASESVMLDEMEETQEKEDKGKSLLADANYKEADKVKSADHYGDAYNKKFVKSLPKSKLQKEYKV